MCHALGGGIGSIAGLGMRPMIAAGDVTLVEGTIILMKQHKFILPVLALLASSQASIAWAQTGEEEPTLSVRCGPMEGEGSFPDSGELSAPLKVSLRGNDEDDSGWRPPYCSMTGSAKGGSFRCACADGAKPSGTLSAELLQDMFKNQEKVFEWCEEELVRACGPFPELIETSCETPHGECGSFMYSRLAGEGYTDIEQECACKDGRTWYTATAAADAFDHTSVAPKAACEAQVRACAPGHDGSSGMAGIELPAGVEQNSEHSGASCENAAGDCRVRSGAATTSVVCTCFDSPEAQEGVEIPRALSSLSEQLETCFKELEICGDPAQGPGHSTPEPLPEPDVEEEGEVKDAGAPVKPKEAQPGHPGVLPGCTLGASPFGAPLASAMTVLLMAGLRRRRRE